MNNSTIDWEEFKVDLEGLSKSQLALVLKVIEEMKVDNEAVEEMVKRGHKRMRAEP